MEHRHQHQVEQRAQPDAPTINSIFWLHYRPEFQPDIDQLQAQPTPWLRLTCLDDALTPSGRTWLQQRGSEFWPYAFRTLFHEPGGVLDLLHERDRVLHVFVGAAGRIFDILASPQCDDAAHPGIDVANDVEFERICRNFLDRGATHVLTCHLDDGRHAAQTRDLMENLEPLPHLVEKRDMLDLGPAPSLATKEERIAALEVGHLLEWSSNPGTGPWFIASRELVQTLDHPALQWRIYTVPQEVTARTVDARVEERISLATKRERIAAFDAGYQLQWANEIGLRAWFVATREHVHSLDDDTIRWRVKPPQDGLAVPMTGADAGAASQATSDPGFYGRMAARLSLRNDRLNKALVALIAGCEEIARTTGDEQVAGQLARLVRTGRQEQALANGPSSEASDA